MTDVKTIIAHIGPYNNGVAINTTVINQVITFGVEAGATAPLFGRLFILFVSIAYRI